MDPQHYAVLFDGRLKEGYLRGQVILNLSKIFKMPISKIAALFCGESKIIKKNIDKTTAKRYFRAFDHAGAICTIRRLSPPSLSQADSQPSEMAAASSFRCPRCAHRQPPADNCRRCGFPIRYEEDKSLLDHLKSSGTTPLVIGALIVTIITAAIPISRKIKNNPVPAVPVYMARLADDHFPDIPPPSEFSDLKWNFSAGADYNYVYRQTILNKIQMPEFMDQGNQEYSPEMTLQGDLTVRSRGDGSADLFIRNLSVTGEMASPYDPSPLYFEQQYAGYVIQGMNEWGMLPHAGNSYEESMNLNFALPDRPVRKNQAVDFPARIYFNVTGSRLIVTGTNRVTLVGYKQVGPYRCAKIKSDFEISTVDIPPELEGEYAISLQGSSICYFDIDNQCYVCGHVARKTDFHVDAPLPGMKAPVPIPSERMNMSAVSDEYIVMIREGMESLMPAQPVRKL